MFGWLADCFIDVLADRLIVCVAVVFALQYFVRIVGLSFLRGVVGFVSVHFIDRPL